MVGFYEGDDGAAGVCSVVGVFIEKNPTANSMKAIHINTKPTKIIVKTAPINNSNPAMPNMFTPDFAARRLNDFL